MQFISNEEVESVSFINRAEDLTEVDLLACELPAS